MKAYRHLHRKGPFGLFLQKIEASSDPEIMKIVKSYQDETFINEVFFRRVAGRKKKVPIQSKFLKFQASSNCRLSDDKVYEKLKSNDKRAVKHGGTASSFDEICKNGADTCISREDGGSGECDGHQTILEDPTLHQRNILLNYYLFKRLNDETKKRYSKIFRKRYNVPLTNSFCKQYLTVKKPERFRKTSFLLWLNTYLRDKVSTEILRLPSFEIALKAGNVWNTLPNEEKKKWYKLLNKDMYLKKF